MTEHDESEEHIFEDEDQDILRSEDIGQVVEDDHQGDEPMSEEETDDPETAADIANQLTFEDDSIQGFFDHEGMRYNISQCMSSTPL